MNLSLLAVVHASGAASEYEAVYGSSKNMKDSSRIPEDESHAEPLAETDSAFEGHDGFDSSNGSLSKYAANEPTSKKRNGSEIPGRTAATRASAEEAQYAEYRLTERIRGSTGWIGTSDLRHFLESQTSWGTHGNRDSRTRTLQNWLEKLRALADKTRLFAYRELPSGAFEYRAVDREHLTLEGACMALLAERFLDPLLPAEYLEDNLHEHFLAARRRIGDHERDLGKNGDAVSSLLSRIAMAPRGQRLNCPTPPYNVVQAVTTAILKRRCLESVYRGKARRLHPYALVFRDPKYYVLAVEDTAIVMDGEVVPRLYLSSRFSEIAVCTVGNLVPDDFAVADWIAESGFDIPLPETSYSLGTRFELCLRIRGINDNLLVDLVDFPLSSRQTLDTETGNDSCLLRAPDMRATESLVEWILGRGARVEVLAPEFFRDVVAGRLRDSHALYK